MDLLKTGYKTELGEGWKGDWMGNQAGRHKGNIKVKRWVEKLEKLQAQKRQTGGVEIKNIIYSDRNEAHGSVVG
jgi:hypothetical protein